MIAAVRATVAATTIRNHHRISSKTSVIRTTITTTLRRRKSNYSYSSRFYQINNTTRRTRTSITTPTTAPAAGIAQQLSSLLNISDNNRKFYINNNNCRRNFTIMTIEEGKDQNTTTETVSSKEEKDSTTTNKISNNTNRERKNQNNANKKRKSKRNNSYHNLKKKKKDHANNPANNYKYNNRRKSDDEGGEQERSERNTIPHSGSFASIAMQEKYDKKVVVAVPTTTTTTTLNENNDENNKEATTVTTKTTVKRKVALLISYLGTAYTGFQMNELQYTVQSEIELALYKAGLIQHSNFGFPHKYSWSTSGRTDKGVHACAQVVSAKLEFEHTNENNNNNKEKDNTITDVGVFNTLMKKAVERINTHLPSDIIVLDMKRTTRNFCAKTARSRVRYQYMIPSYIFSPDIQKVFQSECGITLDNTTNDRSPQDPLTPDEIQKVLSKIKNYRITDTQYDTLQKALSKYNGTHAYHNFTRRMEPGDKTSKRYILDFKAEKPVVISKDNTEWIPTQVIGQSFLLNQIRKMVALAIDVVRLPNKVTIDDTMTYALNVKNPKVIRIPTAPAEGLFLDMSIYDAYNERKNKVTQTPANAVDDLNWIELSSDHPTLQQWKKFKVDVVQQKIIDQESNEGNFIKYLYLETYVSSSSKNYYVKKDDNDKKINEE